MKYDSQILKKGKHWRVLQITTDYLPSADKTREAMERWKYHFTKSGI